MDTSALHRDIDSFVDHLSQVRRGSAHTSKAYRRDLRRAEYGDERDVKMKQHLEAISPTNLVHLISDPLLVAQGLNDPRVPASESEQIVAAAQAAEQPVWYVLAEDEGHGFRKQKNRDYYYAALSYFFEKHLVGRSDAK